MSIVEAFWPKNYEINRWTVRILLILNYRMKSQKSILQNFSIKFIKTYRHWYLRFGLWCEYISWHSSQTLSITECRASFAGILHFLGFELFNILSLNVLEFVSTAALSPALSSSIWSLSSMSIESGRVLALTGRSMREMETRSPSNLIQLGRLSLFMKEFKGENILLSLKAYHTNVR